MNPKQVTKAVNDLMVDVAYIQNDTRELGNLTKGSPEHTRVLGELNKHCDDILQAVNTLKSYFSGTNA